MKDRCGYVFENDGKWYARITLTDSDGNRRNVKRTAGTKAEAKQLLRTLQTQLKGNNDKQAIDALRMTFDDLCDYYEQHYAKSAKFVNNQKTEGLRDFQRVKAFITHYRARFGRKKVRDITFDDIRSYRTARLSVPTPNYKTQRSITSINRELAYLRRIFNIALRQGWIDRNPFNCGEPLILTSCERKRERILTTEEEARLLTACDHPLRKHLRPLLIALLDTGARKGEMLKLTWDDVDFESGIISIQAMNTKTLRTRQVPITARFQIELELLWANSDKQSSALVFGICDNVRKSFSTACVVAGIKEGGIDGLTLHCLRHTAATRLVSGQLPIQMVGRLLGHSQPNTTYRYISMNNDVLNDARSIFESVGR